MNLLARDKKIILISSCICLAVAFLMRHYPFLGIIGLILGIFLISDLLFIKIPVFPYDKILSAVSSDGINWKKEKGVRIGVKGKFFHYGCVYNPFVMKNREGWRMYYRGGPNHFDRIFTSFSNDGLVWDEESVLELDFMKFGLQSVSSCSIIQGEGFQRMYLAGYNNSGWKIYSAISTDEVHWEMEDGVRIDNNSSLDPLFARDPAVIKIDKIIRMYYLGSDGKYSRILTASSLDGLNWQKDGVCIEPLPEKHPKCIRGPYAYPLGQGCFRMYFTGGSRHSDFMNSIMSAISRDGVNWNREEGIRLRYGGWVDFCGALTPCVISDKELLRMYYAGVGVHFLYPLTRFRHCRYVKKNNL